MPGCWCGAAEVVVEGTGGLVGPLLSAAAEAAGVRTCLELGETGCVGASLASLSGVGSMSVSASMGLG